MTRVWKIEASATSERHPSKWGYALASCREEAMKLCVATSELPYNYVHEKHRDTVWPGREDDKVSW